VNASAEEINSDRPVLGWLPWHAQAVARVATAVADQRLPHALLVHGPAGVGKDIFAWTLAAAMHCRERLEAFGPCGHCAECALSAAGCPTCTFTKTEDDLTRSASSRRARHDEHARISHGDHHAGTMMTPNAQWRTARTLEEPAPERSCCSSSRLSGLLATLRSRCQRIEIARPELSEARVVELSARRRAPLGLLELAGGSPRALEPRTGAPLEAQMLTARGAGDWARRVTVVANDLLVRLPAARLARALAGCRRTCTHAGHCDQLTLPGSALLQRTVATVNITAVFNLMDRIRETRRCSTFRPALLVESLWSS
jgi:DNA polymerase-3 subunit delta'